MHSDWIPAGVYAREGKCRNDKQKNTTVLASANTVVLVFVQEASLTLTADNNRWWRVKETRFWIEEPLTRIKCHRLRPLARKQ